MAEFSIIRRLLAGLCLVLFAFSITPKIVLHNLVANHKDGRTKTSLVDPSSTQLSKASFNCQCDNLISESPFVDAAQPAYIVTEISFKAYKNVFVEKVYATQLFCSALRGPPCVNDRLVNG
ncbi:MAG: hypothetical protein ABI581_00340 [Sediminibacterium sp.]